METDIENMKNHLENIKQRKGNLEKNVEDITNKYVDYVQELEGEVDQTQTELRRWATIRDKFEKLSNELEGDRTSGSYRYQYSIEELLARIDRLEGESEEMHAILMDFDRKLQSQTMGIFDIEQIIKVGKLAELEKRDLLIQDLNAKTLRIKELLQVKEQLEVDMAPAGVVNFMYSNLTTIQEEIRNDIKVFVGHKASQVLKLEQMLRIFKDNNAQAIEQEKEASRENAKNRAFDSILHIKVISNKIMSDIFAAANEEPEEMERATVNADQYGDLLEQKFADDMFQKNREIRRLQEAVNEKERQIQAMRDKLNKDVAHGRPDIQASGV